MNANHNDPPGLKVMPESKVMIVEDEAIVAKDIETSLTAMGYSICGIVASGEDALALARQVHPDLILLDIMLKGALDGIATANQIKTELDIPVIFLTAYSDDSTISRAKGTNAFGYLLKPFEERELHTTIEMALYKSELESKLKRNRQWLETILCSIAEAVITTDIEGRIEFVNPATERLTGFRASEMEGRALSEIVRLQRKNNQTTVEISPRLVLRNDTVFYPEGDIVLIARGGKPIAVEYSLVPLRYSGDKIAGIILVLRDVVARQQSLAREQALQRRLSRAQRMESLGMLANGVAEQLQRILGPMRDYPDLILNKMPPPDDNIKQNLVMIQNSAQKAIDILSDLITLGHMRDYALEPLNLNGLLGDFLNSPLLKTQRQNAPLIDFQIEITPQPVSLIGCKKYLLELLNNLVAHAAASITRLGRVKVAAASEKVAGPLSGFEVIETGEYAVLRVADTGRGREAEDLNRFFEPFSDPSDSDERRQRNGLRTALAYAIIKGHKGMIDIKSEKNKGTEVIVYFPLYSGPAAAEAALNPDPGLTESQISRAVGTARIDIQGNETIMVVDDDSELRKITAGYLRSIGYKVVVARNGSEAIELIKAGIQNKEQAIDLVVLDMIMADSLDGLDTYKTILQFNPRQKAIIVSGFTITERIKTAMQIGVGQYLLKPYDQEELAQTVRKELDKPAGRD